jgi:hypothetical protein
LLTTHGAAGADRSACGFSADNHCEELEHWSPWVTEVRKTKIGIGTILGESRLLDVEGRYISAVPTIIHFSSLKRHKDFLVESYHKVSGFRVRIEPVLSSVPGNGHGHAAQTPLPPTASTAPSLTSSPNQQYVTFADALRSVTYCSSEPLR